MRRQAGLRALSRTALYLLPVCAVAAVVLGVLTLKENGAEDPIPDEAVLPDPLAGLPPNLKTELLTAETRMPAELKLTFTGNPQDLCTELADLGMENSGWRRALFTKSRWQCVSDLVHLTTPSVDYGPATLFFALRGPDEGHIDHLRLKVNVEDPAQLDIGQNAARIVIGALSDRYSWAVPEAFLEAIAGFKPLEMTDRGVRLSVAPEDPDLTGDATALQRMNIILDFGEPDFIRPADEFRQVPPFR